MTDAATVPRPLSIGARLGIYFATPYWMFGLPLVLLAGLMLFFSRADIAHSLAFGSDARVVVGVVSDKQLEGTGRSRHYRYDYTYPAGGQTLKGRSYDQGRGPELGQRVRVEYLPERPEHSRIRGMQAHTTSMYGVGAAMLALATGVGCLCLSWWHWFRNMQLVRYGVLTKSLSVTVSESGIGLNNVPLFDADYVYTTTQGEVHQATLRRFETRIFADEQHEPLVYDARDPARAILLDAMSPNIRRLITGAWGPQR